MSFGENSVELGDGVIYMMKEDSDIFVELGAVHSGSIENETITWAFDPTFMVDFANELKEFSFEVKLSTWPMLKIIFKHRGFWYTAAFIFYRMWNKFVALFKKKPKED
jgi:hypothetical protein